MCLRLFKFIARRFSKSPFISKKEFGATYVPSVSGFSDVAEFALPYFAEQKRPLTFAIGCIVKKSGIVGSEIKIRIIRTWTQLG